MKLINWKLILGRFPVADVSKISRLSEVFPSLFVFNPNLRTKHEVETLGRNTRQKY